MQCLCHVVQSQRTKVSFLFSSTSKRVQHIHGVLILQSNVITDDVANTSWVCRCLLKHKSHVFKGFLEGVSKSAVLIPTTLEGFPITTNRCSSHGCHRLSNQTTDVALCSFDRRRDSTQDRVVDVCPETLNDLVRNLRLLVVKRFADVRQALVNKVVELSDGINVTISMLVSHDKSIQETWTLLAHGPQSVNRLL